MPLEKATFLVKKLALPFAFHFINDNPFVIDNNLQYAQQIAIYPYLRSIIILEIAHILLILNDISYWPVLCSCLNKFK